MGSIQEGHMADLMVFDGNVMEHPKEWVHELNLVLTLVGGTVANESPDL